MGSIQRATKKWYKKVLYFGIEAAIINSKIIRDKKYGKETNIIEFKERITKCIFEQYIEIKKIKENEVKEENNYIPWKIRNSLHNIGHTVNIKKVCKNCGKRTPYICNECKIYLHPECFTEYHQNKVYNKFNHN